MISMGKKLNQNWKKLILCIFIITFILIIFYSFSTNKQDNNVQSSITPLPEISSHVDQVIKNDIFIATQEECDKVAKENFNENLRAFGEKMTASYTNQFNREKGCFAYEIYFKEGKDGFTDKELVGLDFKEGHEGVLAGHYLKEKNGKLVFCQVRTYEAGFQYDWNYCQNEKEFDKLIDKFGYFK